MTKPNRVAEAEAAAIAEEDAETKAKRITDVVDAYDEAETPEARKAALSGLAEDTMHELVRIDLECRRGGTSLGQVLSKTVQNIAGIAGI